MEGKPSKVVFFGKSRAITLTTEKVVKFEIRLGLPFIVPGHVYIIQMLCLRRTLVNMRKPNVERSYRLPDRDR